MDIPAIENNGNFTLGSFLLTLTWTEVIVDHNNIWPVNNMNVLELLAISIFPLTHQILGTFSNAGPVAFMTTGMSTGVC